MRFFTDSMEAQLHQELYVAILDSLLTERGSIQQLAAKTALSPVYLSNIRNLELAPPKIPTPKTAKNIADNLAAPAEVREAALQHMVLAHERRVHAQRVIKEEFVFRSLPDLVSELGDQHHLATFARSPLEAHRHFCGVAESAAQALREFAPEEDPLAFVRLCLIQHDVCSTLNRPYDAIWYAKRARYVMEYLDPARYRTDHELADYLTLNVLYAEAVSYGSLGLYADARDLYDKTDAVVVERPQRMYWEHAIIRGKIRSLSNIPRFSIRKVEALADAGRDACQETSAEIAPLWDLLIAEAMILAYMRHENYRDAEMVMNYALEGLDKAPLIGPIHRVTVFQSCAQLRWAIHDLAGWRYFLTEARSLAIQAGLVRKIDQIEGEIRSRQKETRPDSGDNTTR